LANVELFRRICGFGFGFGCGFGFGVEVEERRG
jgi:hypothetical protein